MEESRVTPSEVLKSPWNEFLDKLKKMDEETAWAALAIEHNGQRRYSYLARLYGTANRLRAERERREWLGGM